MTEQEKIKYAYELMVKNNPDEAVKTLIRFDKNLRNLGMGGLHKKPNKFYDLSELPNEANILVSPKGYGKTYHELKILTNRITKAIEYINVNQDEKTLCLNYHQLKKLRDILKGEENE